MPRCWIAALLLITPAAAADGLPDEAAARRQGPAALPRILRFAESPDPDLRLRAQRLARLVAMDFFRAAAPVGMRLVPGRLTVTAKEVRPVGGFFLSTHEVTLGEFRRFAKRHRIRVNRWKEGAAALPVTNVSLAEARAYAKEHGARLPTRAELNWAVRGGGRFRYPWGDRFDPARVNSREAGRGRLEPVGSRPRGASVHGVAHLLGNAAEWTDTERGRGRFYVVGGSYRGYARVARFDTYLLALQARAPDVGFRLAKSLPAIPRS